MQTPPKEQIAAIPEQERKKAGPHPLGPVKVRQPFALFFVARQTKIETAITPAPMPFAATQLFPKDSR